MSEGCNGPAGAAGMRETRIGAIAPRASSPSTPELFKLRDGEAEFRSGEARAKTDDMEAAVAHYKAALRTDPSHLGARMGLGKLQFVEPDQPLRNEMRRRSSPDVCDVYIAVRNPCNYRCFYCVAAGHNAEPTQRFNLSAIERVYQLIPNKLVVTAFECGGGEPTVHPEFPDLLELCAKYGAVSFPTNNSQDPARWLPKGAAERLDIRAALHPEAESRLEKFLEYAATLVEAGATFRCQFIAHPTRLERLDHYRRLFQARGILFHPIPFIGTYNGKQYPHAYAKEEQDLIGRCLQRPSIGLKISPHVHRIRNFRGIPCIAGKNLIYVRQDGTMQRCLYDDAIIDAPLAQAKPCSVANCGCGLFLERLNFTQTAHYHNVFAGLAKLDPFDLDWEEEAARDFGYEDAATGLASEYVAMYDALMAAFGKDEFPE